MQRTAIITCHSDNEHDRVMKCWGVCFHCDVVELQTIHAKSGTGRHEDCLNEHHDLDVAGLGGCHSCGAALSTIDYSDSPNADHVHGLEFRFNKTSRLLERWFATEEDRRRVMADDSLFDARRLGCISC